MEIITAGDGTAHVSSADDGTIYAGIAGNECYVTGVGDRLSCTMQGANTALVGTGVGIMYGRAFRVAMPEEVTIQSGTQSQRRNDVICAHFTTSSEGHESGELIVLKGTPTSGQEAEDPEIPSGDILEGATEAYMPLWRIPLDGINVGEPEAMFDVLMSMSELQGEIAEVRDSVSQLWPVGRAIWLTDAVTPQSLGLPGTWQSYRWSLTTNVGSVLDVKDGLVDRDGAQVQIYHYNGTLSQQWHAYAEGPGRVMLWVRIS